MAALGARFDGAMARFGPFEARPFLAVAVSGGADSMALALLADKWVRRRGGRTLALIVDHGLRRDSAGESADTAQRLHGRGVESRILRLSGLSAGGGLQAAARLARHEVLAKAAAEAGCLNLAFGHHAADQAETVAMRAKRGAGGLEGIAGWSARGRVALLRPLLAESPSTLRDYLRHEGVAWVDDPSNRDRRFERVRLRFAGVQDEPAAPERRQKREAEVAVFLAQHVTIRPEGFAVIHAAAAPPTALGVLIRTISGAQHAPRNDGVASLCTALRPATLGGVRIMPAGRLGAGWLLAREPSLCGAAVPASYGAMWDKRFQLAEAGEQGWHFGGLGADAARFRTSGGLPSVVLQGMACLRGPADEIYFPVAAQFLPTQPAASGPFSP